MLFRSSTVAFLLLSMAHVQAQDGPATCNANPECAALELADDCCPTNLAGIFLDCCEDKSASCAANVGCRGLVDDCCPTKDGTFLYCCLNTDSEGDGYTYDYTYYGHARGENLGQYWVSTGDGKALGQQTHVQTIEYKRNPDLLYDLIYFRGNVPDAGAYKTGDKKFSIQIPRTTAPECTQVLLQLEHVPFSEESLVSRQIDPNLFQPYPKNRHSRYLANVASNSNPDGYIEFTYLDSPDEEVPDGDVNAVVLMFAPGTRTSDTFTFHNLDSNNKCSGAGEGSACQPSPVNSCPAVYLTIEGADTAASTQDAPDDIAITQDAPDDIATTQDAPDDVAITQAAADDTNTNSSSRLLQSDPADCSDCANPACVGAEECVVEDSIGSLSIDNDFDTPAENIPADEDTETTETTNTTSGETPPTEETTNGAGSNGDTSSPETPGTSASGSFLSNAWVAGIVAGAAVMIVN